MSHTLTRPGRPSSGQPRAAWVARVGGARSVPVTLALALLFGLSAAFVAPATPALAQSQTAPVDAGTSATGQAIVDFAMQYYGSPYVWAGNTPAGFDCSGFTQFVVQNVTGLDITHGTESQLAYGTPVDYASLLPGDLVYFAGTYGPGVSHVGIYIGDGQIIHAENESTGVTISDLWGGYDAYYYSAIRIG